LKTLIVLSKDTAPNRPEWDALVRSRFSAGIVEVQNDLASAVEFLESIASDPHQCFDLILCDYTQKSTALLQALLTAGEATPIIVSMRPGSGILNKINTPNLLAQIETKDPRIDVPKILDGLIANGTLKQNFQKDVDFVSIKPESLIENDIILTDIYVRLAPNRFIKMMRAQESLSKEDLIKFKESRKVDKLFISKKDVEFLLEKETAQLKKIDEATTSPEQAEKATARALENLRNVVGKTGFTPKAAEVAHTSVVVALKIIGNSPSLSGILKHLKKGQGQYITDHSIALAQIACGLAYAVGWHSPSTFFKLTLAAFLHDITLNDDALAECRTLNEALEQKKWETPEINAFKTHPINAADLVKHMHAIPPDVDSIILQHHERPDGSGFPRHMGSTNISPLAAAFIMAHDMVHFFLKNGSNAKIQDFYQAHEAEYTKGGAFRKIFKALIESAQIPIEG